MGTSKRIVQITEKSEDKENILNLKEYKLFEKVMMKEKLSFKNYARVISSEARLGISGSFIEPSQIFEKKNAIERPNKIKILIIHKYK